MKKILFFALMLVALSACDKKMKTYTISGTLDIPEEIPFGDTVINREPLDGMFVYLLDLSGETLDSALVTNETFKFEGELAPDEEFFAYVVCQYSYGVVAIEPGDISMVIGSEVTSCGTPTNDGMGEVDMFVGDLAMEFEEYLLEATLQNDDDKKQELFEEFNVRCMQMLDSINESKDNKLLELYINDIKNSILIDTRGDFIEDEDF